MIKNAFKKIAAAAFWILVWQLFALIVNNPLLVPTPYEVAVRLAKLCITGEFWLTVGTSFLRITVGIVVSLVIGIILGVLVSRFELVNVLVSPVMSIVKATPVASFILLAFLWINENLLPVFITALIVVPVVTSNVSTGIKSVDKKLIEVAKVFGFPMLRKVKRLYIPSVFPYFMSACRSSLGLGWKAGIAAEVLVVPVLSIGKMIYDSKIYLETTDLFAWTVVVIFLSAFVEFVICFALNKVGQNYERRVGNNA